MLNSRLSKQQLTQRKCGLRKQGRRMEVFFAIAGKPVPKGSKILRRSRGKAWMTDDQAHRVKAWQATIALSALEAALEAGVRQPWTGGVSVFLLFHRKPKHGDPPATPPAGDIDKLARTALDAMTGVIYQDDRQVMFLVAEKRWGELDELRVIVRKGTGNAEF